MGVVIKALDAASGAAKGGRQGGYTLGRQPVNRENEHAHKT